MTVKTLERTVQKLSQEIVSLRSFVVDVIRNEDDEGEYKTSFIRNVLMSMKKKATFEYSGKGSLLRHIKRA